MSRRAPRMVARAMRAVELLGADGVLAPVEPRVPSNAPVWVRRVQFYDK